MEDIPWRLSIAQEIVRAKISAQRRVLKRCCRNYPQLSLEAASERMQETMALIPACQTLPKLMGVEGAAARVYFQALPAALRRPMPFQGRNRRPPKDPVNALLSLGYGLLTSELIGVMVGVGLDPQIGIFHSSRGRMPALAEDMLEMFRAPVADALALSLVNLGVLQEKDFVTTSEGGVQLSKPALEVYFKHYRRRMQTPFRNREGENTTLRLELQRLASHLRRVILQEESFTPYLAQEGGPVRGGNPKVLR